MPLLCQSVAQNQENNVQNKFTNLADINLNTQGSYTYSTLGCIKNVYWNFKSVVVSNDANWETNKGEVKHILKGEYC